MNSGASVDTTGGRGQLPEGGIELHTPATPVRGDRKGPLTVLVTRPLPGGRELAERLQAAGFHAEIFPSVEIAPAGDPSPLREAAVRVLEGAYDWIVLTSANGVGAFARALEGGRQGRGEAAASPAETTLSGVRIAVVGAVTAAAVEREGWRAELIPDVFTAEALADALGAQPLSGARVLMPVAAAARDLLPNALRARGAQVDVVEAYRSVVPEGGDPERLRALLRDGGADLVSFASPSAAEGFLELGGGRSLALPAAVIGPVTREAAERLGFRVVVEAEPHTVAGLVDAIAAWAGEASGSPPRP